MHALPAANAAQHASPDYCIKHFATRLHGIVPTFAANNNAKIWDTITIITAHATIMTAASRATAAIMSMKRKP